MLYSHLARVVRVWLHIHSVSPELLAFLAALLHLRNVSAEDSDREDVGLCEHTHIDQHRHQFTPLGGFGFVQPRGRLVLLVEQVRGRLVIRQLLLGRVAPNILENRRRSSSSSCSHYINLSNS